MIERLAGGLAVATAAVGMWMGLRHAWDIRPHRATRALHLLGGALLLALALVAARVPSGLTIGMIAAALASGMAVPLTAKSLSESAGMIMLTHGTLAIAAVALVVFWAMAG